MKKLILKPKLPLAMPPGMVPDTTLPPPPPQFNKPVGDPPPPRELPRTFEECEERARQAANGQIEKAQLWATLAQAHAANRIAEKLDALNEFLGVYDEAEEEDLDDGEKAADPRIADAIAEGILNAASIIKDDLGSSKLMQMVLAAAVEGAEQHMAQRKAETT